ncbi:MAG: hypothetical protein LBR23_08650 [Spirochaetaceae bacterium]|jgi:hypothetical protein|nr:hypothetical protein [Spirochaetaceae bacterium]
MSKSGNAPEAKAQFQAGIRKKLAEELVFEYIFQSPALFGYSDFSEDSKSAFLLSVTLEIPKYISNFDPRRCTFLTFLVHLVHLHAKGWVRWAAKGKASEDSLRYCYALERDTNLEVAEEEGVYMDTAALSRFQHNKVTADTLVVLALKSAYSITDHHIASIAGLTGYDRDMLEEMVEKAKGLLHGKETKLRTAAERRNKAYFYKIKYRFELEKLSPGTTQHEIVAKQFLYQSRLLEAKNRRLMNYPGISPPNSCIAEMLNMPLRRVSRLIEQAQEAVCPNVPIVKKSVRAYYEGETML